MRRSCALLVGFVLLALAPLARAQSIDGYFELQGFRTEDTTQVRNEPPVSATTQSLIQRFGLNYIQPLWPNLELRLGGYFERNRSTTELGPLRADGTQTRVRPFITLRLTTDTLRGEVGADRNETISEFAGFETRLTRDTFRSSLGWYPDSRNFVQLQAFTADDYDKSRTTLDSTTAVFGGSAQYRPADWLTLQYSGGMEKVEDHLRGSELDTDTQNVRVIYVQSFFRSRVNVGATYNASWLSATTRAQPGSNIDIRLFPIAGLSALDDLPDRDPLANTPALIDNDRTTPAGLNIGLPAPGADLSRRNFGVDFGVPRNVNVFRVWVDREITRESVARSFSWDIWTSDDNLNWTLVRSLPTAPFGPFENRFELVFSTVTARYVKVTTKPLDPSVEFATEYPEIQITELEAFERVPGQGFEQTIDRTTQQVLLNSRVVLLERPGLFYDFGYVQYDSTGSERTTSMVNGLSLSHVFNRVFSAVARVADERGKDARGEQHTVSYSGSVTASPLPTLQANVLLTGRREDIAQRKSDSDTLIASAIANIYKGLSFNAGFGRTAQKDPDTGRESNGVLTNLGLQVSPHPALQFSVLYTDSSQKDTGGGLPDVDRPNKAWDFGITFSPFPSLYLFGSARREQRPDIGDRNLHSYTVSWSPFQMGTLRFNFQYNEYYESQDESLSRIWGPSLRWNITPRTYFDLAYQESSNEYNAGRADRNLFSGTLRVSF